MPKRNLAWILVVATIALVMWQLPQTIAGRDSVYRAFGPLVDARAQIHRRFVEDVDDEKLVGGAVRAGIAAMIQSLDDVHAIYLDRDEYQRFKERTDGVFGGIGVDVWPTDAGLGVLDCEPNSPASKAGIHPGDMITHVDGQPAHQLSLVDAVNNLLNGVPDSDVTLTIERFPDGQAEPPVEVRLKRAVIQLDPIRGWLRDASGDWRFMLDAESAIGYVKLTKFTPDVDERLDARMNRLLREGLHGLILDLRDNTGGLLNSAIEVADRFLDSGVIVSTRGRGSAEKRWSATHDIGYPSFPMVVLINGSTASAAEIVAGALRDQRRATLIGERSYGKGSVQEVVELGQGSGAIKLTTAYYYLPGGECIHKTAAAIHRGDWGVAPTMPVACPLSERKQWLRTWREMNRASETGLRSPPAASMTQPASQAVELVQVEALIKADPQLQAAFKQLRKQVLAPGRPRSNTSQPTR